MKYRATLFLLIEIILFVLPTGALEFGTNWTGSFYNNTSLSGNVAATLSGLNGLNFNWPDSPAANVNADNFSARFTSTQNFSQGRYQFTVTFDDGARVFIDGQNAFEDLSGGPAKTRTFERDMTAGSHALTVELIERTDTAVLQFQWFLAGTAPQPTVGPSPTPGPTNTPVPTGLPPVAPGALSATVIRAPVLNARSGPYLGAPVVGRLLRGQTYNVIGRDARAYWFLLQLSDKQAWAFGYYLAINGNEFNAPVVSSFVTQGNPAAQTGVVAKSRAGLKLRAAPTVASDQIGRIPWGAILPVTGRTGGDGAWWRVIWKGTEGWVFSPYLELIEGNIRDVPTIQ